MDNGATGAIVLDLNEEAKYIANKIMCSIEMALDFVFLEDTFMELLELNVYEETDPKDLSSDIVLDEEEMHQYIAEHSELLTIKDCEKIQEVENEYFIMLGIIKEEDFK